MLPVCEQIKKELINWNGIHLSVMEMSHRSQEYLHIHNQLIQNLRTFFNVPKNYDILLMQGGATLQYSAVPMNLLAPNQVPTYLITGQYSQEAFNEAKKFCNPKSIQLGEEVNSTSSYLYYCDNETNDGIQLNFIPKSNGAFLVCDMTSSFGTKFIDINQYGCIFASLQCNFGMAGLCCVIIREDLIGKSHRKIPSMANYKIMKEYNSIYNTIPCFNVYTTGLLVEFMLNNYDLQYIQDQQIKKSSLIYDFIDSSDGIWITKVQDINLRSRNNIIFKHKNKICINNLENIILLENGWYNLTIYLTTSIEQLQQIVDELKQLNKY